MTQQQVPTGVEVTTGFFPLAFILYLCTPTIEINGVPNRRSWGTTFFELPAGRYRITVYFAYIFKPRCGENSVDIDVQPGRVLRVNFNMPPWMFSRGKMTVTG